MNNLSLENKEIYILYWINSHFKCQEMAENAVLSVKIPRAAWGRERSIDQRPLSLLHLTTSPRSSMQFTCLKKTQATISISRMIMSRSCIGMSFSCAEPLSYTFFSYYYVFMHETFRTRQLGRRIYISFAIMHL